MADDHIRMGDEPIRKILGVPPPRDDTARGARLHIRAKLKPLRPPPGDPIAQLEPGAPPAPNPYFFLDNPDFQRRVRDAVRQVIGEIEDRYRIRLVEIEALRMTPGSVILNIVLQILNDASTAIHDATNFLRNIEEFQRKLEELLVRALETIYQFEAVAIFTVSSPNAQPSGGRSPADQQIRAIASPVSMIVTGVLVAGALWLASWRWLSGAPPAIAPDASGIDERLRRMELDLTILRSGARGLSAEKGCNLQVVCQKGGCCEPGCDAPAVRRCK